jgi:septal ring factor EnvC (AmiA/AmiB activator)
MFGLDKIIAVGLSGVALVAVIAVAWAAHDMGEQKQLKRDQPVIAKLNTDLAECKATLGQQRDALKTQNDAITQMGIEAQERKAASDRDIRKARDEARVYRAKAERIAKARPGPDQCASARELIVDALGTER